MRTCARGAVHPAHDAKQMMQPERLNSKSDYFDVRREITLRSFMRRITLQASAFYLRFQDKGLAMKL